MSQSQVIFEDAIACSMLISDYVATFSKHIDIKLIKTSTWWKAKINVNCK
jgi:hypothetical protein